MRLLVRNLSIALTGGLLLLGGCSNLDRSEQARWSIDGYRLGVLPDSQLRVLSCADHTPSQSEPWTKECYGGPNLDLGLAGDDTLAYIVEDLSWGGELDARELWRRTSARFVEILGTPDTVTDAVATCDGITLFCNKLSVYWSRPETGDCAELEVMSAPYRGGRDRTLLTIGPRSTMRGLCDAPDGS